MDPILKLFSELASWIGQGFHIITNYLVNAKLDQDLLEHKATHKNNPYPLWCQFCQLETHLRETLGYRRLVIERTPGQDVVD